MQTYFNPKRESDPHALPDCEVFYLSEGEMFQGGEHSAREDEPDYLPAGWYYWACFPGCLPDSDPCGPFNSAEEAEADAQSEAWQEDDEAED